VEHKDTADTAQLYKWLKQHSAAKGLPSDLLQAAAAMHRQVVQLLCSHDYVSKHGVYPVDQQLLAEWAELAVKQNVAAVGEPGRQLYLLALAGWRTYASTQRHTAAASELQQLFESQLLNPGTRLNADRKAFAAAQAEVTAASSSPHCPKPLALSPRMLAAMQACIPALQAHSPLLLTGPDGCGKASVLIALARLMAMPYSSYQMTPGERCNRLKPPQTHAAL
jgi:hypothetical protein